MIKSEWTLTGSMRARQGWFGKMIYQVQEFRDIGQVRGDETEWWSKEYRWRDATLDDIVELRAYRQ